MRVVAVVAAHADKGFAAERPDCLQRMRPYEEETADLLRSHGTGDFDQRIAHRWYPLLQPAPLLCYSHEASRRVLFERVRAVLATTDGVAFDGFGYRNHYACFCDRCRADRGRIAGRGPQAAGAGGESPQLVATHAEAGLIEISRLLFDHAKEVKPGSIVMNHVWPPFNPNPYYGAELYLDYCCQTISWFYRPAWSLERVELEAAEHRRRQIPGRNRFVPFIGLYHDPYQGRSAERIGREIDIALEYGEGSLVLCTLQAPWQDESIGAAVRDALGRA
jgi:hypothetical protein